MLQLQAKSDLGHDRLREIGKTQVYVFIRLTTFMRECGYHEYSVALWQAALEFVLLRPNLITEPEALQSFSVYWDDECPRLGEPKYQGWSLHAEAGEDQMPPDPNITELEQISGAGQLFQQFGLAEENMALKLAMPGHMADDAGEDDPFHVILFSDISPFLSTLLRDFPAKSALISGFLCFAELPPLPISSEYESLEWWQDSFLRNKISNLWAADVSNSESGSGTIPLASTIKFRQITTEVLFSDAFQSDPPLPLQIDWIEKTLQDLVQSNAGNDLLAEYFLAFTLQHRPSS
jgi:hypothetical protein